jgi:diacylglycerol kinase family enzyme
MRHFFVINPRSFKNRSELDALLSEIKACFADEQEYVIYHSEYPRAAVTAIHNYIVAVPPGEAVRVYAVGGDGILFDCLNGMADFPNAELTAIPYGSSNDTIRGFFGENAKERFREIKSLTHATTRPVDILRCGANYAINEVGIGIPGETVMYANSMFRGKRGKLWSKLPGFVYFVAVIRALFTSEMMWQSYKIYMDGEESCSGKYNNIRVGNGPCNGGTQLPDPHAKPDDGLLGGMFSYATNPFAMFIYFLDYYKGHYAKRNVFFRKQFKKITLQSDVPIRAQMDGDPFTSKELEIEILPGHIKFAAPEDMPFADYAHRAYKGGKRGGRK